MADGNVQEALVALALCGYRVEAYNALDPHDQRTLFKEAVTRECAHRKIQLLGLTFLARQGDGERCWKIVAMSTPARVCSEKLPVGEGSPTGIEALQKVCDWLARC